MIPKLRSFLLLLTLTGSMLWISQPTATAQEPLQVGEAVEFDFGSQVLSGKVVESLGNGRIVKVEVFFDGQNRVFTRAGKLIRRVGGEPPAAQPEPALRQWTDASGSFSVQAKLVGRDAASVELLKEDGNTIRVPIEKLSAKDQQYIKSLEGGNGPTTVVQLSLPAATEMPAGTSFAIGAVETTQPLAADPTECSLPLPSVITVSLPEAPITAEQSSPLLIDGTNGRLVYSTAVSRNGAMQTTATLIDLASQQIADVAQWETDKLRLVAADPIHGRALALADFDKSGPKSLVLVEQLSTSNPKVELRWSLPAEHTEAGHKIRRVFLTPAAVAIVQYGPLTFAWDLAARRGLWTIQDAGKTLPAITPGGRYLAVQHQDLVAVVEVATGQLLGTIKLPNAFPAGLAFSPDGTQLLVGHLSNVKVYDLRSWTTSSEMNLWSEPPHAYDASGWVDDRHVLLAGGLLIRPAEHLVLWKYPIINRVQERFDTLPYGFHACIYGRGMQSTLIAASLPHAAASAAAADNARPDFALRSGDTVSIRIETGGAPVDETELREATERLLQRSGWQVGTGGQAELAVTLTRTEEREVEYQTLSGAGTNREKVKFAPWKTSLKLVRDDQMLWEREFTPGSPQNLTSQNKSTQELVRRYEVPDVKILDRFTLLPHITARDYENGYGSSGFDGNGITDYPRQAGESNSVAPDRP